MSATPIGTFNQKIQCRNAADDGAADERAEGDGKAGDAAQAPMNAPRRLAGTPARGSSASGA
jgi:hypothetical protein